MFFTERHQWLLLKHFTVTALRLYFEETNVLKLENFQENVHDGIEFSFNQRINKTAALKKNEVSRGYFPGNSCDGLLLTTMVG